MNFKVKIPFVNLSVIDANREHKKFFDALFFETKNNKKEAKFNVEVRVQKKISASPKLFVEKNCYSDGDNFVVTDTKQNKCVLNINSFTKDRISLNIEPEFDLYYLFTFILEPLIIIWAAEHNVLFLHASGIAKNNRITVFPAWRNTGKTNTILEKCRNAYDFCGDDFCIVHNKSAYLYPKSLNVFSYNLKAFPSVYRYLGTATQYRLQITTKVKSFIFLLSQKLSGPASKVLFRISELAEVSTNIKLSPDQLNITVCETGQLSELVLLVKSIENKEQKLKDSTAHAMILNTIQYELKDFFELYSKYQFLVSPKTHAIIQNFEKNYLTLLKNNTVKTTLKLIPKGSQ